MVLAAAIRSASVWSKSPCNWTVTTGLIRLHHLADATRRSLGEFVLDCVKLGSTEHTDGWRGYAGLERAGYVHQVTPTRGDDAITARRVPPRPFGHFTAEPLANWHSSRRCRHETIAALSR